MLSSKYREVPADTSEQVAFRSIETLTRIALPVEIVLRVAVTFQFRPQIIACWAMCERNVVVCNVVEKVNLFLLEHQTRGDGVDRSIAPALIEEATVTVQGLEVVDIGLRSEPVKVANLEV